MIRAIFLLLVFTVRLSFAGVPDILEKVLPAVVTVGVKEVSDEDFSQVWGFAKKYDSDDAYSKILDMSGVIGSGSGFIVKRNNKLYVITNAHVIAGASKTKGSLVIYSIDRKEYKVKLIGADSFFDIAVLEFIDKPDKNVSYIEFETDAPRVGEDVYAIGNPRGEFPYSVTDGIISGKNRYLKGLTGIYGYIQTTAPTTWGNSGGPLINSEGNVVGINTRIHIEDIVYQFIGFALEARIANNAVEEIINYGNVRRCFTGLIITQQFERYKGKTYDKLDYRPIVKTVIPGSPAEKIFKDKIGAQIIAINGSEVRNINEALGAFEEAEYNSVLSITYSYQGSRETVKIKSSELDSRNLTKIANFFFDKFVDMTLAEKNSRVVMKKKNVGKRKKRGLFKELRLDNKNLRKGRTLNLKTLKNETTILAAGWNNMLWQVNSIRDLAVALRLSVINGGLVYVKKTHGGNKDFFWISGDENIACKTLAY